MNVLGKLAHGSVVDQSIWRDRPEHARHRIDGFPFGGRLRAQQTMQFFPNGEWALGGVEVLQHQHVGPMLGKRERACITLVVPDVEFEKIHAAFRPWFSA